MITLVKGDIVKQDTDWLVNSTNADLYWEDATVNGLFHLACGNEYTKWCTKWVNENGQLNFGDCAISPPFGLQSKGILNVYCPTYHSRNCMNIMRSIFAGCISHVNGESISFPFLGTGVFMFPISEMFKAFAFGMVDVTNFGIQLPTEIRFVAYTDNDYKCANEILPHIIQQLSLVRIPLFLD